MKINDLSLYNFRNYEEAHLNFDENINIFIGKNGSGKTNLLESIFVLAVTKSHRAYIEKTLINNNKVMMKIVGEISTKNSNKKLEMVLNSKGKRVSINNIGIKKISNYISNFDVILFCPDDLELIKGSPNQRRRFLNIEIGQLDNKYFKYLNEYNILIKNRNEYLKTITFNKYDNKYLEILNKQIIDKALIIYKYRFSFIKNINDKINLIYNRISKGNINIEYKNSCDITEYDKEKLSGILFKKLNNNLRKEIAQGNTLYGPHKDDFEVYIDENNARDYGSQGQQRLLVLCIKISEISIFKEETGEYPVLLLDDVFSELDITKRNKVVSFLNKKMQVFITSTDIKNISKKILKDAKIFSIKDGNIK